MKLIFKYLKRYKKLFILNIFSVFLIASAELGIPFIISMIIDKAIVANDMTLVSEYVVYLILVAITGAIGNVVLNFCSSRTSSYILRDLRNDMFAKVQTFSPKEMNELGVSTMLSRTTTDVFQILNFVTTFYRSAVLAPLMLIFSVTLIILRSPQLSISLLIVIPIVILVLVLVVKLTKKMSERQQKQLDQLNLVTRENLTGVRVIRAFRKSKYEQKRFSNINDEYTDTSVKLFRIMVSIEPAFFFLFNSSILILLYFGARYIDVGNISLGQLTEFVDYQFHVMFSILTFSLIFIMFPRTMVSARRIKEVLEKEVAIENNEKAIELTEQIETFSFNNVDFKYPDADEALLSNITFEAKKGEVVAFVGSTGSGKSTLIQLIPRLFEATSGEIKINNIDIKDFEIHSLRQKIGYILQKALLFKGTIKDNITFGMSNYDEEQLLKAIKISQSEEFIKSKPKGIDDEVSELGSNLSGGQKQRLSIARAIAKNPDVLVFDDSFSALDYKTDFLLREALFKETKDKIVFIVAQRLSTIMKADNIIVLHEGKIIAQGKHDELLSTCEIYKEIAASQNLLVEEK